MTNYQGKTVTLINLESKKGAALNGLKGNVIGHQSNNNILRLLIKLSNNDPTIYKIKVENVVIEKGQQKNQQTKQIKKCMKIVQQYLKQIQLSEQKDRDDIKYRLQLFKQHFQQYKMGNYEHSLKCLDLPQIICKGNQYLQQMKKMIPKCLHGNGKFCIKDLYLNTKDSNQALIRLREYMISGFCVKCQIVTFENFNSD